ncbi:hypothetical protein B0H19DRAFT_1384461 [Mycena capillaripes]|nr:hypothetical protein B0H19DRAFT_1384461 [Mycena capillaripes]
MAFEFYSPPVYAQAAPDPGWSGSDCLPFPPSTPRDTLSDAVDPQQFLSFANHPAYSEQPLLELFQPTHFDAADPTFEYATGHPQYTVFPHPIPEQPNTFFPSLYAAQYMQQDAPYPASDTFPKFNLPSIETAPFAPHLPANLPPYPLAQSTSMIPPQDSRQQPENQPRQAALPVPIDTDCSGGRKRKRVEKKETINPPSKRARARGVKFHEKHPEIQAKIITFAANPSRANTPSRGNTPPVPRNVKPASLSRQVIPPPPSAEHGSQPASRDPDSQAGRPASYPVTLIQVPSGGLLSPSLDEAAHYAPPADVQPSNNHLAFIRIDRLLYGKNNLPLPKPLPKGDKLIVSLFRGVALDERRRREGNEFYGNELYDPRTDARVVLRILRIMQSEEVQPARVRAETGLPLGPSFTPLQPLPYEPRGRYADSIPPTHSRPRWITSPAAPSPTVDGFHPPASAPIAFELQDPTVLQSIQRAPTDIYSEFLANSGDNGANPSSFQFLDNYLV